MFCYIYIYILLKHSHRLSFFFFLQNLVILKIKLYVDFSLSYLNILYNSFYSLSLYHINIYFLENISSLILIYFTNSQNNP
jgi:hypothetical protein